MLFTTALSVDKHNTYNNRAPQECRSTVSVQTEPGTSASRMSHSLHSVIAISLAVTHKRGHQKQVNEVVNTQHSNKPIINISLP